jgi:dipeptidyl aminopeptidase/acylaminoacyl peptidase
MRDEALKQALREAAIPVPADAEQRGQRVVEAAHAERAVPNRGAAEKRRPLPRFALALGIATLLAALLLSPAGAAVRDWVGEVVESSAPKPEPELARIPGGGRLLVQSAAGPWVVQPDGSRRLLGDYEEASWSPRGLFVAAAEGRTLSAIEPGGAPHWSLTAPARVSDPRWAPTGERIAYLSGDELRVVAGDGTGDHLVNPDTAPVAPAWSPFGTPEVAYVNAEGQLRIGSSEKEASRSGAPPDMAGGVAGREVTQIEWGASGRLILEVSSNRIHLQRMRLSKLEGRSEFGARTALPVPAAASVVDAAVAPDRPAVAAVATHWRDRGTRSEVLLFAPGAEKPRSLLTVPGSLGEVAWSPDGRRLLVAWPGANQWLFLSVGRGRARAVANISTAFSPGGRAASFPKIEGWCCRR